MVRWLRILSLMHDDLSPKEIAQRMGTSENSINQSLSYMRKREGVQRTSTLLVKNHDLILKFKANREQKRHGGQAA